MQCSVCGCPLQGTWRFCPVCGGHMMSSSDKATNEYALAICMYKGDNVVKDGEVENKSHVYSFEPLMQQGNLEKVNQSYSDPDLDTRSITSIDLNETAMGGADANSLGPWSETYSNEMYSDSESSLTDDLKIEEHTEFMKESAKILKEKGYAALIEKFENESSKWKSIPLNVAVVGQSGTGKSSFINAIRGINHTSQRCAAEVDVTECTAAITPYPHPEHPNLVLYDVPGVGIESFPEKTYLQQIDIDKYDFFILTNSTRFTELDTWLAEKVISRQKKFYFVRTKIDSDIDNNQKDNGKSKEYTFHHIRENCLNHLRKFAIKDPKVFLVNNHNTYDYDFGILSETLIKELPDLKREVMALSISTTSEAVLKVKVQVLKKRIYKVAVFSALGSMSPLPGTGIALDVMILIKETKFYKKQLGTDEESIIDLANKLGVKVDDIHQRLDIQSAILLRSRLAFLSFFAGSTISGVIGAVTKLALPGVGNLISGLTAYPFCVISLRKSLNMCHVEALKVQGYLKDWIQFNT